MKPKPTPPLQSDIDKDLAQALSDLGATGFDIRNCDAIVYEKLVVHWKKHKTNPTVQELAKASGKDQSAVHNALAQLIDDGKVVRVRRGVYVPLSV